MLQQIADRFIPAGYPSDEELRRSARLVLNTMLLTSLFSLNYLVYSHLIGFVPGVWFMLFNAGAFLVLPFMFRAGWLSRDALALLFLVIGTLGVFGSAWFQGGYFSATLIWMALIPLMAILLSSLRVAIVFTGIAAGFILLLWWMEVSGRRTPNLIAGEHFQLWHLNNMTGLLLITFVVALVFYQTKTRAFRNVQQKNDQLTAEKERSEWLLLNILPAEVAEELKATGHAEAQEFDQVTVLFSDFKDFTTISEDMSAKELVEELNACFMAFDAIVEEHHVEKIKTIGDAYMAAAGLRDRGGGSAAEVVHAGLRMQAFLQGRTTERQALGKPVFGMRIGIHTGPVVAGIVGVKKFQYDLWGDTVNTASRMESSGEVGQVNISEATYTLVKDEQGLSFMHRGKVQAKGKGEMEMYFAARTGAA